MRSFRLNRLLKVACTALATCCSAVAGALLIPADTAAVGAAALASNKANSQWEHVDQHVSK